DGATAAAVSIIENDKVYYLILNLNNCDVEPSETHYLIISVDGANTITKELDYGLNPSANQDLM
ncbi:MAG: hypothetical protein QGH90_04635, partial [Candidatus Poseidoniaceae archaeon]|nr:hypothetical protein [Candidatus Poseidoniaceae archaeon]